MSISELKRVIENEDSLRELRIALTDPVKSMNIVDSAIRDIPLSHAIQRCKDAGYTVLKSTKKAGRNSLCKCGSGKKHKRCCAK